MPVRTPEAIAIASLGYMGSQFLDPVLRDQFLQAVSKDPNVLKDLPATMPVRTPEAIADPI